jgi:hypothetical protein
MTQLDAAGQDVTTLEAAPTRYVEGHGIRFAYRRLGPATPPMRRLYPATSAASTAANRRSNVPPATSAPGYARPPHQSMAGCFGAISNVG